jgi:hypothetical protein
MVRVIQKVEPTYFEQAVGNLEWDNAMDKKMAVLDALGIGSFTKGQESNWVQMGVQNQTQCRWIYEQIQGKIGCQRLCPNLWHRL